MHFDNNRFGWKDTIEKDSEERALVPEGDYNARILWVEKGEFPGSARLSACPKAIVSMVLDTGDVPTPITTTLLLHRRLEWKLREFFRAVGLAKHGVPYRMDWENLGGAKLRVHVKHHTYMTDDGDKRVTSQIDRFYDYDDRFFPGDPAWLMEAMDAEISEDGIPF